MSQHFTERTSIKTEVFESYVQLDGYWGAVTSSIDWCERNYVVSYFIAEFWNTLSNVVFLLLAAWGLWQCSKYKHEPRFVFTFASVAVVALGSTAFHASLSYIGQMADELPMLWAGYVWTYNFWWMDPAVEEKYAHTNYQSLSILFLVFCGFISLIVHGVFSFIIVFQLSFLFINLYLGVGHLIPHLKAAEAAGAKNTWYARAAPVLVCIAFVFWLLDCHACRHLHSLPYEIPNPQFHGWWHIINGVSTYYVPTFMIHRRTQLQSSSVPEVRTICFGMLPYIHIDSKFRCSKTKRS